jgi:hypothetical protein
MRSRGTRTLLGTVALLLLALPLKAGVGDPTLETDHPDYPGEGAFQTVEQCVKRATAGKTTAQDKAIALYLWLLTHQYHLMSPQECTVAGKTANTAKEDPDLIVRDAQRARFSYGYGLCGTVHSWNEVYWRALGMKARCRAFPGHTNSEVEYDGAWHAFDTDMAGLVFRRDGVVAGYDDIIKDPTLIDVNKAPLPRYPFAWPGDFNGMKQGWKQVSRGGNWYKMYNTAYDGQPGIVELRSGESFTRWFDRDHFGADKRLFWHNGKGGPFRDWTFVNMGTPQHDGARANARGNASYCNGEFVYRPDLGKPAYCEGVARQTENIVRGEESPKLRSKDGAAASVTFQHFSPYVIAGRPANGVNPMTGPATGGLVVTGEVVGSVMVEVSADQGQTWQQAGTVSGKFEKDLTDTVKGHYGWQVRFGLKDRAGLDALTFTTVTQVSQAIYPRLKPDGSTVVYRAASRGVVPVLPNLGTEGEAPAYEEKSLRSANVRYNAQGPKSRLAYSVLGPRPGSVVFRIDAPTPLLALHAAARYPIRVPPPEKADYKLEYSTDGGKSWKPLGRAETPRDNEFSSGWMYGKADVSAARVKSALVRATLFQGGYPAGLLAAELYGICETPAPQALRLTYGWKEGGALKTHTEKVPAGSKEWKFTVPTGKTIKDEFIRMEVP